MPSILHLRSKTLPTAGVDFEQLFENFPDPVLYIGPDKRIAACNRSFRDRFPILVESRFLTPLQNMLEASQEGHAIAVLPLIEAKRESITNGGTWPPLQPSVTRLSSGGLLVQFTPLREVELEHRREIDRLGNRLQQAEQALHAASGRLAAYTKNLANTTHELRTPLSAVVGFSDMMRGRIFGPLGDERYERYADIIHDSGLRLLDLINDILDFAKLDAGKLELQLEPVDFHRTVLESLREVELLAAKASVATRVLFRESLDPVMADHKRLRQMLANLLSNAIKFTPEGGEISIDVHQRGKAVAISVSDTGIGMSQSDIAVALEPFGQLRSKAPRRAAGTGLGLPLTEQLARLHGGRLEIESVPGAGTTVTIFLPMQGDERERAECPNGPPASELSASQH